MAKYGNSNESKMLSDEESFSDKKAESTRNITKDEKPINPKTSGYIGSTGRTAKIDEFTRPSRTNKILY